MTNDKFRVIVEQYEKLVFTICYQFVKDYQEAQNLTQETFLSAYTHIDSCSAQSYKPWLARIAANKAKDFLKSAYQRKVQLHTEEDEESNVISLMPRPEQVYLDKEGVEEIKEKVYSLKEPYLKVSVLFFLEEKTIDEVARIVDRPPKTVKTQVYRARGLLQKMIKEGD